MAKHPSEINIKPGWSKAVLFYGLFLLVVLGYGAAGFGVGVPELLIWLALLVGWVSLWMVKRRR